MGKHSRIANWKALAGLLEDFAADSEARKGWIFRGESWLPDEPKELKELKAKCGRISDASGSPRKKPYDLQDEKDALLRFKKDARPYINYEPTWEIEWLSIAQHHGMSTRLLDWTESLLVAAYFAAIHAGDKDKRGIIYGICGLQELPREYEQNIWDIPKPFNIQTAPYLTQDTRSAQCFYDPSKARGNI